MRKRQNVKTSRPQNVETSKRQNGSAAAGWHLAAVIVGLILPLTGGCQELVHMGHISDRDASWAVSGATIEQQQPDGGWKRLDETDGGGRWWIPKDNVRGGGRIRISKPGYYTKYMRESEFMQENNILMVPSEASNPEEDSGHMWQSGPDARGSR